MIKKIFDQLLLDSCNNDFVHINEVFEKISNLEDDHIEEKKNKNNIEKVNFKFFDEQNDKQRTKKLFSFDESDKNYKIFKKKIKTQEVQKSSNGEKKIEDHVFESSSVFDYAFKLGLHYAHHLNSQSIKNILDKKKEEESNQIDLVLNYFKEKEERDFDQLSMIIKNIIVMLVKSVVSYEIKINHLNIESVVKNCIQLFNCDEGCSLSVSPEDYDRVSQLLKHRNINVSSDHTIQKGGCCLYNDHGAVDQTIETRIKMAIENFFNELC